jgi:hypothetical protein
MPKKTSRYARRLRELGCTPYNELFSQSELATIEEFVATLACRPIPWKSQKERKRMVAQGFLPGFLVENGFLFIIDEAGIDWQGPLGIKSDLLRLGFTDTDTDPRFADAKSKGTLH